jgi:hypothetical protein
MRLGTQLALAFVASLAASIAVGSGVAILSTRATVADFPTLEPQLHSRIHAEEIAEAKDKSLEIAVVCVPVAVLIVWWSSKRTRRTSATPS